MERSGGRARLDTELPMLLLPNHPVTERKRLDMARTPQDADADACAALFSNQNVCHRYASRALALGESHTMIGKLLGHTQVQTTARYAHLARNSIQTAAARITGSIGGNLSSVQVVNKTTKQ